MNRQHLSLCECVCSSQEPAESTLSHLFIKVRWMRKPFAESVGSFVCLCIKPSFFFFLFAIMSASLRHLLLSPLLIQKCLAERYTQRICISVHSSVATRISVYLIFFACKQTVDFHILEWNGGGSLLKSPAKPTASSKVRMCLMCRGLR